MVKQQQKLGKRNTYTPTDASQVCRSVSSDLNREETLSDSTLKTSPNNLDVNLRSSKTERNTSVFVINLRGKSLMPTTPAKARHLIQQSKARVVSCKPFTIQLTKATGETKQNIILGIDAGSKFIGYSATTNKEELICGEFSIRQDVSKKISERVMYRRNKRNKLWYRKPKFLNRVKSKHKGWLAPSLQCKVDTHIRLIEKIKSVLPISQVIIEIAKFDAHKLQDVDISGVEYQQGQMQGYDNLRSFILCRDNYTCQICNKKEGVFDIHHIIQRKDGGSNRPNNLVCVHIGCHKKFHKCKIQHDFKKPKQFKDTIIMNNIKKYVVDKINCDVTYGYITKRKRINNNIEKTHYNDAFVISGGESQSRCTPKFNKQIRRNNRCLQLNRKGFARSIRRQRYKIQSNDVIEFENKNYLSKGCHCKGRRVIIIKNNKNKSVSIKNIRRIEYGKGIVLRNRQFLTNLKEGISLAQT